MREKPAQTQAQSPSDLHQYWSDHVSRWKKTNLSKAEYCRQNGLAKHRFHYWFHKLERSAEAPPTVVPLSFPLQDPPPEHTTVLSVKVGSRFEVTIQGDFHPPVLKKLIRTLEALS
jgi:hypothetical protein